MDEDEQFRHALRRLREARGWSQAQVASELRDRGFTNFHPTTVSRIEKGDRSVRLAEARGLADVFDTTVRQMVLDPPAARFVEHLTIAVTQIDACRQKASRLRSQAASWRLDATELLDKFSRGEAGFELDALPSEQRTAILDLVEKAKMAVAEDHDSAP